MFTVQSIQFKMTCRAGETVNVLMTSRWSNVTMLDIVPRNNRLGCSERLRGRDAAPRCGTSSGFRARHCATKICLPASTVLKLAVCAKLMHLGLLLEVLRRILYDGASHVDLESVT
jgi:hypothetical protein